MPGHRHLHSREGRCRSTRARAATVEPQRRIPRRFPDRHSCPSCQPVSSIGPPPCYSQAPIQSRGSCHGCCPPLRPPSSRFRAEARRARGAGRCRATAAAARARGAYQCGRSSSGAVAECARDADEGARQRHQRTARGAPGSSGANSSRPGSQRSSHRAKGRRGAASAAQGPRQAARRCAHRHRATGEDYCSPSSREVPCSRRQGRRP